MLKKNHRLKRIYFEEIFKSGKILHSPNFIIRVLPAKSWDDVAFSVVVSKKVVQRAVLRNSNKRRVYNSLKIALESLEKPYKGAIVLKKDIRNISPKSISDELLKTLK